MSHIVLPKENFWTKETLVNATKTLLSEKEAMETAKNLTAKYKAPFQIFKLEKTISIEYKIEEA